MGVMGRRGVKNDEDFKYTEEFMQEKLSNFFSRSSVKYDIDGLYIFDWESDKFLETRSGYIYEFEVKISKADFKNDFKHKKDKHIILEGEEKYGDKYLPKFYELLEANKKQGDWAYKSFLKWNADRPYYLVGGHKRPNYFYYCTPPDLITADDVPSYAGLVYIDKSGLITIKKKAPKLHNDKIKDEELGLGEKFYYNMDSWRYKCKKAQENANYWHEKLNKELEDKGQGRAYKDLENELEGYKKAYHELIEDSAKAKAQLHRDLSTQSILARHLAMEVKKYNPEFDFGKYYEELFGTGN